MGDQMSRDGDQAILSYSRQPISAAIILAKLTKSRGNLVGVRPEKLLPYAPTEPLQLVPQ
jgi:hypothetical protein